MRLNIGGPPYNNKLNKGWRIRFGRSYAIQSEVVTGHNIQSECNFPDTLLGKAECCVNFSLLSLSFRVFAVQSHQNMRVSPLLEHSRYATVQIQVKS